jgi:nucleoid-associated protein YgaU
MEVKAKPVVIPASPAESTDKPKLATTPIIIGANAGMAAAAGAPAVEQYRVFSVVAVEGETWEMFSQKYYGDTRCAMALREFNRNYPFASQRLRQDGVAQPGDTVHIPDLKMLLDRHRSLVRDDIPAVPISSTSRPLR